MTDFPDTPAGQRSNRWQDEVVEPSCCGPVRPKINTTPIKLHSIVYIVCGVLSVGLGIVACVFECLYNGLSIPAGVLLIATGVVGLCVRKHGALAIVYGWLNPFCFLYGIALLVFMLAALPGEKGYWHSFCSSYDCKSRYYYSDSCCYDEKFIFKWENVGIDLAILVVGVIVMVTSLAANIISLRLLNWVKFCCLKKNMHSGQVGSAGSQVNGQSSPAMKLCWTPCDSNGHRNATIILSIIHMSIGVISVGLGIGAIIVECRHAHIGMPIWTGILIFMVTGFYGFLSTTEKGAYIPCFFAFSILAYLMSINMFSWAAVNIPNEEHCADKCFKSCYIAPTESPYYYPYYTTETPDPRKYCCDLRYTCDYNTEAVVLHSLILVFGFLEMLVCMATFGLSFSQLSCYMCCSTCRCCETKKDTAYQMVMTTDGNIMMVAVPNTQHGMTPSLVNNQQMMPQHMMIPANPVTAGQNQTSGSPVQPNIVGGQLLVQGNGQPQPMMFQGNAQPMVVHGQVQPMVVQGQSQPMMAQGQSKPMVIQGQRQPMIVQTQVQGMVASGQVPSQPGMATQSMFIQQPVVPDGQDAGVVQSQMQQNNQPVLAPQSHLTNQTASAHIQAGSQEVEQPAVVSEDANQGIEVIPNPTV